MGWSGPRPLPHDLGLHLRIFQPLWTRPESSWVRAGHWSPALQRARRGTPVKYKDGGDLDKVNMEKDGYHGATGSGSGSYGSQDYYGGNAEVVYIQPPSQGGPLQGLVDLLGESIWLAFKALFGVDFRSFMFLLIMAGAALLMGLTALILTMSGRRRRRRRSPDGTDSNAGLRAFDMVWWPPGESRGPLGCFQTRAFLDSLHSSQQICYINLAST